MKKNVTAAASVPRLVMKVPSACSMARPKLLRDDYCDGLGDCLPACPTGAITFIEREAAAYDEAAVIENKKRQQQTAEKPLACGCPGSQSRQIQRDNAPSEPSRTPASDQAVPSQLRQWPVQIKLAL